MKSARNNLSFLGLFLLLVLLFSHCAWASGPTVAIRIGSSVATEKLKRDEKVEVLKSVLLDSGLFSGIVATGQADYLLTVEIVQEFYDESNWLDSRATYIVKWELKSHVSKDVVWEDTISTSKTAGFLTSRASDFRPIWRSNVEQAVSAISELGLAASMARTSYIPPPEILLPPPTWNLENIAVVDLTAYALSAGEAGTLTDKLRNTIVQTKYFRVLSNTEMREILEQQNFQRTEYCADSVCLVEMGKILAVQQIVGGTIGKVGGTFHLSVRMVDVTTGEIVHIVERQHTGEPDHLIYLMDEVGKALLLRYAEQRGLE